MAIITGDGKKNYLIGTSLADTINGGAGIDTMEGGAGDDTYIVDNTKDVIIELVGEGSDTVQSSVSYTLSAEVENITATAADITLTGNAKDNILSDGGQSTVSLKGGTGNDTYLLSGTGTTITDTGGIDTVSSAAAITLASFTTIENAILTGAGAVNITGNLLANRLAGNSAVNTLDGGAGNDVLDGGDDAVADVLIGGAGNDTYIVRAGDVVQETGGGIDLIKTDITFTLAIASLADIENLTLTGAGTANATGNDLANTLRGNTADNVLDGGIGADKMIGGDGNDTYHVNLATDTVTELADEGTTDKIFSSISINALAANVEELELTTSANLNGTGNAADNIITGNSGNNILKGMAGVDTLIGGDGNDTLDGGANALIDGEIVGDTLNGGNGNDTYLVDSFDKIQNDTGGVDTVKFTGANGSTFAFANGDGLDNIILMGSTHIGATGNNLKNTMTGNGGNNTLDGAGGNDTLVGGAGNDELIGGAGIDNLSGDAGNDTLKGGTERDILLGGAGNDTLDGGDGNDTLTGGIGKDTITTGAGEDVVVFGLGTSDTKATIAGMDVVTDLDFEFDVIRLTVAVAEVGTAVTGATGVTEANLVSGLNTALNVSGAGFDTSITGDVAAAIVTFDGALTAGTLNDRSFLAVDLDKNGSFTASDFVIELTAFSGTLSVDSFAV